MGDDCNTSRSCASGLRCVAGSDAGGWTCQPQAPEGARCWADDECLSDECADGSPDAGIPGRREEGVCTQHALSSPRQNSGVQGLGGLDFLGFLMFFTAAIGSRRAR